jgi:shikimate dehydrogenase
MTQGTNDTQTRAAVIGSPIAHSLSPTLHRAAYRRLGLTHWRYDAFDVDEAALPAFIAGLDDSWAGLSLTMPLKRAVIPLLDSVSETALAVEAVNTVVFGAHGSRRGENSDVPGLAAALAERGIGKAQSAAILGGGATAASAIAALASTVTVGVDVYVRTLGRAARLIPVAERYGVTLRVRPWAQVREALSRPLVVNTTPAGAADELVDDVVKPAGTLFDVLYHPWPTPLAAAWERTGGTVLSGLDLLVHQAALQVELMTGCGPTWRAGIVAAMRAAGAAALDER